MHARTPRRRSIRREPAISGRACGVDAPELFFELREKCPRDYKSGLVESQMSPALAVAILVLAIAGLRWQAWRAVLFLRPSGVRVETETPADAAEIPGELEDTVGDLKKLGFVLLGTHSEKIPLLTEKHFVDLAHVESGVVASLTVGPDEQDHLVFVTESEKGFVVTANYRRPAREVPGEYLSGGLDGASAERLLKVHLRRVPEIGPFKRIDTLDSRVESARRWFSRSGKPELRQQHAVGLLWTLFALGMVGAALLRLIGWAQSQ